MIWTIVSSPSPTATRSNWSTKVSGFRRRNLGLFEATFTDASRGVLAGKWFHGAYLADVRVRIADPKGGVILDAVSDGPMFLAKLPPGRYQVVAEANGLARTTTVDAGSGAKRVTLLWPAAADNQGNAKTAPGAMPIR